MSKVQTVSRWYFPRPELAKKYLDQFEFGAGEPMTLFAKRLTGKTTFLLQELRPEAERRGWTPVYIDLWSVRNDPAEAIIGKLKMVYEEMTVPESTIGKRAKTKVTGVNILGQGISLGEEPALTEPENRFLQIGYWLKRIAAISDRNVLLMVDEVQALGSTDDGINVVSAMRSALIELRGAVYVVFTGSSQSGLATLFSHARAALYDFAEQKNLPILTGEFVNHVAARYTEITGLSLDMPKLQSAFTKLENLPHPFISMVVDMASERSTDVDTFLAAHVVARDERQNYRAQWDDLKAMEQAVAYRIAHSRDPMIPEALADYRQALGVNTMNMKSARFAVDTLLRKNILARGEKRHTFIFESESFRKWIVDSISAITL